MNVRTESTCIKEASHDVIIMFIIEINIMRINEKFTIWVFNKSLETI